MDAPKSLDAARENALPSEKLAMSPAVFTVNRITAMAVVLLSVWIIAFDVYASFFLPEYSTVSHVIQYWCIKFPALSALIGFVMGHLLWPIHWPKA